MEWLQRWPSSLVRVSVKTWEPSKPWHEKQGTISSGDDEITANINCDEGKQRGSAAHHFTAASSRYVLRKIGASIYYFLSLLLFLIPRQGRPVRQKALHALAYLDALRGYFALIIYSTHAMPRKFKWIPQPIIANPWLQFPFRGSSASLCMFFWISGYVVTYRIIGFIQTRKHDKFLDTLSSSMFRRYPRLFIPVLGVTFVTIVLTKLGVLIAPGNKVRALRGNFLQCWLRDSMMVLDPVGPVWGWWNKTRYADQILDHFWSINTEFRSSMMLYCFCAATCKMKSRMRKIMTWLIIPVLFYWQASYAGMAFLGMWFAECRQSKVREQEAKQARDAALPVQNELVTQPKESQSEESELGHTGRSSPNAKSESASRLLQYAGFWRQGLTHSGRLARLRDPMLVLIFIYSFVVLRDPQTSSVSTEFPHTFVQRFQRKEWAPQMRMQFHLSVGAFMMLYPLDQLPKLQRPLFTQFSQYLGELSFGIYAMQYTVMWLMWNDRYIKWIQKQAGDRPFDTFSNLFPGYFVMTIVLLWAAELFRKVDVRVVKLCQDMEAKLFM